jgi:formate dehydrogenase subunit beta
VICRFPLPSAPVDLAVAQFEVPEDRLVLKANSEKGVELARALGAEPIPVPEAHESFVKNTMAQLDEAYGKQEAASREKYSDIRALVDELATCIKCMNCMDVCPVCYCKECLFHTDAFNPTAGTLADKARRKEALRMPTETLQFHLTRMAHVMAACVMCGQCESACPSAIPLVEIYAGVNRRIQDLFDYEAGLDLEQAPPFTCFFEEESFEEGAE